MDEHVTETVKWTGDIKACRFRSREAGQEVSVHYATIDSPGFGSLEEDLRVRFCIEPSSKGPQATSVILR